MLDPAKPSAVFDTLLPWFARGEKERWKKPIAEYGDKLLQGALDALRLRFPGVTPHDGSLTILGRDRRIPRAPGEPPASYARRLNLWLDLWGLAGTPLGLLYAIQSYIFPGYPMVRLIERSQLWYTLDEGASATLSPYEAATVECAPAPGFITNPFRYAPPIGAATSPRASFWAHQASPANWNWDSISHPSNSGRWWDFWLLIYPLSYPFQAEYDNGVYYDSPTCWGLDVDPSVIQVLRELLRLYGRSGAHCVSVIFPPNKTDYAPDSIAGPGWPDGKWGWEAIDDGMGNAVPSRNLDNRYLLGFP